MPADGAPLEPAAPAEHRVTGSEPGELLAERQQVGVDGVPVEPRDLVVLAVGVVVAALGPTQLVAARGSSGPPGTTGAWRRGCGADAARSARMSGSSVGPSTPQFHDRLCDSPSRLSSPLASLSFSLYETRSLSGKPSWAVTKLIEAVGRRESSWYRSELPGESIAELGQRGRFAPPEVADRVAVLAVPFRPQGWEVADLIAALPDVPRLGDQLDLADDRVLLDEIEERRQPVDRVQLARQGGGEVEPEPVDVHLGHPVPEAVHDQLQHVRVAHVEAVAGAREVEVVAGGARRRPGSRPGCRCPASTASGPCGCPRRCGCRRRRG